MIFVSFTLIDKILFQFKSQDHYKYWHLKHKCEISKKITEKGKELIIVMTKVGLYQNIKRYNAEFDHRK